MAVTKTASLVFFYFGEESYVNRLAQETVPLKLALDGYDRSVLLHHDTYAGPFKVSDEDAKHATAVDIPTKENLVKQLKDLQAGGYTTDLYVFSHGSTKNFRVSKGTYGENATITAAYIESKITKPIDLRMVWQCNCYGSTMNPTWEKLGAKATAGSRYVNFYPTRFSAFAERWAAGKPFATCLKEADTAVVRTPVQAYMLVDAAARLGEWDGNLIDAARVLGNNGASLRYFQKCWLGDDAKVGVAGKDRMNQSSFMVVGGDGTLTR